jgi:DEAD/DEAH box helicase domain-containing protein
MEIKDYLTQNGWNVVRDSQTPEEHPVFVQPNDLPLSSLGRNILAQYTSGIYRHQHQAIGAVLNGRNVCITTTTASGKSLVFYVSGIEMLQRSPRGTILAVYPLKALTDEQEGKWLQAVKECGSKIVVGRIDGSVAQNRRLKILRESSIVIMTPDVVHAWLLSNLSDTSVRSFLSKLQLVVIDEAHTYTGVFGSNSAFLFRRIHQAATVLGASPRYIAASATINNPVKHMRHLTGLDFILIDRESDSSGRKASRLLMVDPPEDKDVLTNLTNLMRFITLQTSHQFITFVDSRKQTEQLASVMLRGVEPESDDDDFGYDVLEKLQIHPFRAGYESEDRRRIQRRLTAGDIRGVISTSALEMGIDIPWLTLGILYGIPYSATSYFQRVGRVGRHAEGVIIVVNNGSILSNRVFRKPETLDKMPLAESALYLENPRIQYIHSMCLARPGGEYDAVADGTGSVADFALETSFPGTFVQLCKQERIGEISQEFQAMKSEAGDDPNHVYPLRDCEIQFQVETQSRRSPDRKLGSLSHSQVMREAYPGAVYYYQTQPFRVERILSRQHVIVVRPEKRYTTRPSFIPTLVYPNLSSGNVYGVLRYGDLRVVESNIQVKETIVGFKERRGPNENSHQYPLESKLGCFFDLPRFERNYFSSGVLFSHPVLQRNNVNREMLAKILFEAFLIEVPFERQDVRFAADQYRVSRGTLTEGQRFLCVYDQTYGSLRLTSRLMEPEILRGVLEKALDVAQHDDTFEVDQETVDVLDALLKSAAESPEEVHISEDDNLPPENSRVVIMPGSVGLYPDYNNEEFRVDDVKYTPKGLIYKGKRLSQQGARFEEITVTVPVDRIVAIEGRSEFGCYDLDTGEIIPFGSTNVDCGSDVKIMSF